VCCVVLVFYGTSGICIIPYYSTVVLACVWPVWRSLDLVFMARIFLALFPFFLVVRLLSRCSHTSYIRCTSCLFFAFYLYESCIFSSLFFLFSIYGVRCFRFVSLYSPRLGSYTSIQVKTKRRFVTHLPCGDSSAVDG